MRIRLRKSDRRDLGALTAERIRDFSRGLRNAGLAEASLYELKKSIAIFVEDREWIYEIPDSFQTDDEGFVKLPFSQTSAIHPDSLQSIVDNMQLIEDEDGGESIVFHGVELEKISSTTTFPSLRLIQVWQITGITFDGDIGNLVTLGELHTYNFDLAQSLKLWKSSSSSLPEMVTISELATSGKTFQEVLIEKALPSAIRHRYRHAEIDIMNVGMFHPGEVLPIGGPAVAVAVSVTVGGAALAVMVVAGAAAVAICLTQDVEVEAGSVRVKC